MNKLRVVVVGCGYFGLKRILACVQGSSFVSLAAVVDVNKQKAKQVGDTYHVPYGTSVKELKHVTACDIAIIAVPNIYHKSCTIEALSLGLHVLCEKPLAPTYVDALNIVKAAKKYNRFVKTGSNHRYIPSIEKAYSLIREGKIGKVLLFKGSIGNNGNHVKGTWFWNKRLSGGGTFIDNGCHLIDISRWFMGDFVSCVGTVGNVYWKKMAVEDLGTGIFVTKLKQQAIITTSWTQWAGYMSIEIWGDRGYIVIDSKSGDRVTVGNRNNTEKKTYNLSSTNPSSYQKEIEYFATCIKNNTQPSPSASDGAAVIHLIESVYMSAKEKKVVLI